jgi:type I restriction enzyme R subunit
MDEDPALYRKFSEMLKETIQAFRAHLLTEMEYLKKVLEIRDQMVSRGRSDVPSRLAGRDVAQAYYRVVTEKLHELAAEPGDRVLAAEVALMIEDAIDHERVVDGERVVDWQKKTDVMNRMRANIDDGFFELSQQGRIQLNWEAIDEIAGEAARIAKSRLP